MEHEIIEKIRKLNKEINAEEILGEIRFSLAFEPYKVNDYKTKKEYEFPGGHVTVFYDPAEDSLGIPFIEEKYTHPLLGKIDKEKQTPFIGDLNKALKNMSVETRIVVSLQAIINMLETECNNTTFLYRKLEDDVYNKYLVGQSS